MTIPKKLVQYFVHEWLALDLVVGQYYKNMDIFTKTKFDTNISLDTDKDVEEDSNTEVEERWW